MCHFHKQNLLQANPEQGYQQLILLVKERVWNYEKRGLNSYWHPFYQYQQNEQPHLISTH